MTISTHVIDDQTGGAGIGPADAFILSIEYTRVQNPPFQPECQSPFPLPFGRWTSGRFVLRDRERIITSIAPQNGGLGQPLANGRLFVSRGTPIGFKGALVLECIPKGAEFTLKISDDPAELDPDWTTDVRRGIQAGGYKPGQRG